MTMGMKALVAEARERVAAISPQGAREAHGAGGLVLDRCARAGRAGRQGTCA